MKLKDYLPKKEAEMVIYTGELLAVLQSKPSMHYGISSDRIAEYVTTRTNFVEAYTAAQNPTTRTGPAITLKNQRKAVLIRSTRSIVDVCQAFPQMTNDMRRELGISLRGKKPEPTPVPGYAPFIKIAKVNGRLVTMDLQQSTNTKGKPKGAIGANLFVAYGDEPPTGAAGWTLLTGTGKTRLTLRLGEGDEAQKVWINAFWFNGRKESGPSMDEPVCVSLPAVVAQLKGSNAMKMRKAA